MSLPENRIDQHIRPQLGQLVLDTTEVKRMGEEVASWVEVSPKVLKPQTNHGRRKLGGV
jgi:hypothetical protein